MNSIKIKPYTSQTLELRVSGWNVKLKGESQYNDVSIRVYHSLGSLYISIEFKNIKQDGCNGDTIAKCMEILLRNPISNILQNLSNYRPSNRLFMDNQEKDYYSITLE
jgi:hypothetical protein